MKSSYFVLLARFRIDVPGVVFTYCISLLSWGSSLLEFLILSLILSVCNFHIDLVVLASFEQLFYWMFQAREFLNSPDLLLTLRNFFPCLSGLF